MQVRDEMVALLETAAKIARQTESRDDSVAWRVADAALLMRQILTQKNADDVIGFDRATGRGAVLPYGGEALPVFSILDAEGNMHVVYGDAFVREVLRQTFEQALVELDGPYTQ
jgi:hypothetical protein